MFEGWRGRVAAIVGAQRSDDQDGGAAGAQQAQGESPPCGHRADYRRMIVGEIADFLLTHDLELSAINFEFARDIVSGHDVKLTALTHQHLASGGRLSNSVVHQLVAKASPGKLTPEAMTKMLSDVEAQTDALLGIVDRSQTDITRYGSALHSEAAGLNDEDVNSGGVVARLVALTLSMVERTHAIEAEMRQSNKQAKKLKRSLDKARHAADHDSLTGLPNRRAFERRLADAVAEAQALGGRLAVAFCDIDRFKAINDGHGHATGDRVLCLVAELLMRASGNRCHVARHGGEEFVMLFPGREPDQALAIVDNARASLSERRLVNRESGEALPMLTFSAGVADVMAYASPAEALAAADAALYSAKASGRNRVIVACQPDAVIAA